MTTPNYSVVFSAQLVGATTVARGQVLIPSSTSPSTYVIATTANRGSRRSEGIAITAFGSSSPTAVGSVQLQQAGTIDATLSGLAVGTQSWVRCSATGTIERCTPAGGDDIIGYAETDGRVHLLFGLFNSTITNGSGGGGSTPTGTGFRHVTSGTEDAAAQLVVNADVSASAAVAVTKIASSSTTGHVLQSDGSGNLFGFVANANVSTSAAIAVSKLATSATAGHMLQTDGSVNGFGYVADANVSSSAAIAITKLATAGTTGHVLMRTGPTNAFGYVANANVDSAAAIAVTKLATSLTAGHMLQTDGSVNSFGFVTNTNVATAAAIAGTKIAPDFGAQNVVTTGAIRQGGATNSAGVGTSNNTGFYCLNPSTTMRRIAHVDTGDYVRWGDNTGNGHIHHYLFLWGLYNGSQYDLRVIQGTNIACSLPLSGDQGNSMPFRWKSADITQSSTTTTTLTTAQAECPLLLFTGTPGGSFDVRAPSVRDAFFTVVNGTPSQLTLKPASGGTGVIIATGKTAQVRCNAAATDYVRVTADA